MLCADTSGSRLSFTLADSTGTSVNEIHSMSLISHGRMNETFFSGLEELFSAASVKSADRIDQYSVDRWIVITGPGSFTGIRIGIAALSGITVGIGKELAGLSSLDAAALISGRDKVAVAARIRMDEYAVRKYDFTQREYSAIELKELYPPDGDTVFINGKINTTGYDCLSRAICDLRMDDFIGGASPVYVKKSEAEINFDKKSAGF